MKQFRSHRVQMEIERLLNELASSNEPIQINGSENNAILVSEKDWIAIQEALYYLSIPGVLESIECSSVQMVKDSEYQFGLN